MAAANASIDEVQKPAGIRLWERALSWLVLAVALINLGLVAYVVSAQWQVVMDGIRAGALRPLVFLMPCILVVAAVLLVRRSRWALPAFFLHVFASFSYIAAFQGLDAIPWHFWLGYCAELAVVYFCLRLLGRGVLK